MEEEGQKPAPRVSLKELREVVALCRKAGVKELSFGEVRLVMGEPPPSKPRGKAARRLKDETPLMPGMPSDEALAFWSAGGLSEDH